MLMLLGVTEMFWVGSYEIWGGGGVWGFGFGFLFVFNYQFRVYLLF